MQCTWLSLQKKLTICIHSFIPSFVPSLCLSAVYHAVYLDELSVCELREHLCRLLSVRTACVSEILLQQQSGIHVLVTDHVVHNLPDNARYTITGTQGESPVCLFVCPSRRVHNTPVPACRLRELSVSMSVCLTVGMSVRLSVYLSTRVCVISSLTLWVSLSVCLSRRTHTGQSERGDSDICLVCLSTLWFLSQDQ